jgi:subtilase family serine protease
MVVLEVPLIWADNSGEIAPFPLTGAYRATHRADRGNVAIIDFVGNYNKDLDTGESNVEARAVVAREFLRTHPDTYDFLVVFSTFEFATGDALAFHWGVQNKVRGLGLAQYDVSHLFGSAGRLLGYIDMAALARYVTDPLQPAFETVLTTLGHEMLHQWSGRVRFMEASGQLSAALLGRDSSHWSDLLDTHASVLYGHKWRNNHDGSFTSQAIRKFFSPLDLYLAGVYSAAEVPPFLLIDNPQHDPTVLPQPNITVQGTARTLTIDEVIAAEGPRLPAAEQAPKTFRFAWILLTGSGDTVEESQLAAITEVSTKFAERFAVWTGGRALVQVAPEALLTVTTGTPDTLPGGQARATPAALHTALQDGLTWLRQQQRGDGSWMDKLATQLRDTTVALDILSRLDLSFTGQTSALAWLAAQTPESTDYRTRQAQALLAANATTRGLLEPLVALHNADGGWGITAGYASDPLDTALVVMAAGRRPEIDARIIDQALQYLLNNSNPDGGWSILPGGPSRVSVTSRVLLALQTFQRQQSVQAPALAWLASQQQADGGFGESASTVHDTALALQTCIALGAVTQIRAAEAAAYLLARQQTDGSWEGSTYATALAVGALKNLHFPNWHVDSTVSVNVDQPVDGAQITLTLTVRNDGQSPTPAGIVRLFDGEPTQGGRQIGSDVAVPALASGASVTLRLPWDTFGAAGEHTLIALIDPENGQPEVSEQDNRVARTITVAAAPDGVDLAVETFTAMPARPDTLPTALGLSAIIRNSGMSSAEQVRVQLREGESGSVLDEVTLTIAGRSSVAAPFTYTLSKPGTTTFFLVIDPDNAVVETSKTNNTASTTVETTPGVDVQVRASDIALAPLPALQGADLTFTVTLHNIGTSVSPVTTVQYLLTDGNRTLDLGRQTVQIEAGGTVQRTLPWRATLPGDSTFTVQLDPDRLVPERDEQNNTASFHFSVGVVQGPNLAVGFQDMTFAPDPGLAGKPVTLSALVRNTGTVEARDVVVAFYDGDPVHGGVQMTRQTIALLPAAAATMVSTIWPLLPDAADKVIFVSVDPDNTIAEFSEADNSAFRILTVLGLPDLAIDPAAVRLTPGFPTHGATVQVEAQITNLGAQAASDVVVRAFAGDPATGGVQIGTEQRVSVAGGGVAVAPFTWTLSGTETLRTLVIVVDPDNTLEEGSKLNNVAQKRIAAQDTDFFVSHPYVSPNGDGIKDSTRFFFRLPATSTVEVVAVNKDGTVVRHIQHDGVTQTRDGSVEWDGLDDRGRVVRDGSYRLQVRSPAGQNLGEATVVVDNNRSSLVEAVGTPFGLSTNLTCAFDTIVDFIVTDDESSIHATRRFPLKHDAMLYRLRMRLFCASIYSMMFHSVST